MHQLTDHLRRNVVAYLALFVALGGSSYAALKLPTNSVGAKQIKKDAVTSSEVKNRSLLGKDFKRGQLPAGARGADGGTGAPGSAGSPAASMLTGRVEELPGYDDYAYPAGVTPGVGFAAQKDATTLSPAQIIVARDLFVKEDHVSANNVPPRTYALAVNGADSALTCTTTANFSTGGTLQCSDTNDAVTIPAGSTLALHAYTAPHGGGATETAIPIRFGWRATSP